MSGVPSSCPWRPAPDVTHTRRPARAPPHHAGIEERQAAWTLLPVGNGEGLQVLRYNHNQEYKVRSFLAGVFGERFWRAGRHR